MRYMCGATSRDGPLPTLDTASEFRVRSPLCGHLPQVQKLATLELTVCGTLLPLTAQNSKSAYLVFQFNTPINSFRLLHEML